MRMRRSILRAKRYAWLPGLIILVTVITLTVGVFALRQMEANLVSAAGQSLAMAASAVADKIDMFLDERARHAETIALAPTLRGMDRAVITDYLDGVKAAHPDYVWIGLMNHRGVIIAATDPSTVGLERSRSRGFREARDTGKIIWEDVEPVQGTVGMDAVGWAVPVLGPLGKFLGVVSVRVGLPGLEDLQTKTIKAFRARYGFLASVEYQFMTNDGNAFVDSDTLHKGNVNLKRLALPSVLASESGDPGFVEEEQVRRHVPVITGYAKTAERQGLKGSSWTVLIRVDRDDVVEPIRTTLWELGMRGALVYLPLLGFLVWTGRNVRREWVKVQLEQARATAAEARYRLLLESTGEGIYGIDREGRCTFVNQAAAVMLGYEQAELLGKTMHQIHHHSRRDGSPYPIEECPIYSAFRSGEGCWVDNEVMWRRDGTSFPVVYTSYPIFQSGAITGAVVTFMDSTELKQAEAALRRNERRTRAILENALDAVVEMDAEGLITEWNPRAEALFGWKREEVIGRSFVETVIPPRLHDDHQRRFRQQIASGEGPLLGGPVETLACRRDGTEIAVELRISASKEDDGQVISAFIGDITARKRAEAALRASEERFRSAFQHEAIGMSINATDGRWLAVNDALCQMLGYPWSELMALHFRTITHPDDLEADFTYARRLLEGEIRYYQMEKRYLHKSGRIVWGLLSVSLVRDGQGLPQSFTCYIQDITDRKQAETDLQFFKHVIAHAHDPIYWLSPEEGFRFAYVNEAACSHYGYPAETLLQMSVPDWDPQYPIEECEKLWEDLKDTKSRTFETLHRRSTGEIVPVEVTANYVAFGGKEYIAGTIRDITKRKSAETALRERETQLRRALDERDQLSRDLHDNIIQSIYAVGLELEECQTLIEKDSTRVAGTLSHAIGILNMVIRDVRNYIQEEGPYGITNQQLPELLRQIVESLNATRACDFRIEIHQSALARLSSTEAREILSIAREAISNVLRHTTANRGFVGLRGEASGVRLEVMDDGEGFDVQAPSVQGQGLRNIAARAEKLGARLEITSERGQGTRILVEFPKEAEHEWA